jgi:starch-binding outer membrane protein, SusD/RagB family
MRAYRPNDQARRAPGARRLSASLLALTLTMTAACDRLLDVDNPSSVPVEALDDPVLLPQLESAAIQEFQCGFAAWVGTAGMLSGEYYSANGFVNNHPWEWRGIVEIKDNPGSCNFTRTSTFMGFYTPLQHARFQLEDTFKRAEAFTDADAPTRAKVMTEMRAYAGYALTILGEGMCEMTVDGGPKMTKQQTWALAEERFTDAIARATALGGADGTSLLNMARVGRARVRLDLGNLPGAAADAALVPANFVRNAEYSEAALTRENRLYNLTIRNKYISVAPAYRNLTVNGAPDPRVKVVADGNGDDGVTPMFRQQKFTGSTAAVSLPIASYAEAQLILAEAVGGQAGLDAINRVRALSNIAPIATLPADFTALVLEERKRQLFSEGHRYVDMLRKNLPFSSGVDHKGRTISNLTCVPLPNVEVQNNPNLQG